MAGETRDGSEPWDVICSEKEIFQLQYQGIDEDFCLSENHT